MEKASTGIPVLDELLQEGLPSSSIIIVIGDLDAGRSLFCNQVTYNLLHKGFHVLYYTVDQSLNDVKKSMKNFGWDTMPFEEKGLIRFVDAFQWGMETLIEQPKEGREREGRSLPSRIAEITHDLRRFIREGRSFILKALGKKMLILFDSMSPLFFGYEDKGKVIEFLQSFKHTTRTCKAVGIFTIQSGVHGEEIETACTELADGVIELKKITQAAHVERYLRIVKMGKRKFSGEYHSMEITGDGIVVHRLPV